MPIANVTHDEQFKRLVQDLNQNSEVYHCLDFGAGLKINGVYNMDRYIQYYGIPEDLKGYSVLDIGTASGYLAFECARRGAQVTAIDIWEGSRFEAFAKGMRLPVRYFQKNIYELDESFGQFDIVICSSLLLHLGDLYGAIRQLRRVCRGQAIVATLYHEDKDNPERPSCEFLGLRDESSAGEYYTYWSVTPPGLTRMLRTAGFASAKEVSRFVLRPEKECSFETPHLVVHATCA